MTEMDEGCALLLDWADLLSRTIGQRQEIATADVVYMIRTCLTPTTKESS